MKLFPVHIFLKDCSFLFVYFLLLRFNVTGETFSADTRANFPEAPHMKFTDMLAASIIYNILPILVSSVIYFVLYFILPRPFERAPRSSVLSIGILFSFTTPIVYLAAGANPFKSATTVLALLISTMISISGYYFFNRRKTL
ncbi:MAG: hypothetical protein EOP49_13405 [Sphingobacteriales bacterium]|nr:MAG: hypothetical protein EOP49_13405 [Sphingobacteriales bacterium]